MNAQLVMFRADGTRRDFPIKKSRIVLGRTNSCDLRIPLSSVSRKHCELRIEGEQVTLRDLGSSNGTFHNNIRIQEAALDAGDEIGIGPVVFTLVIDGKPEKVRAVRTIVDAEESNLDDELGDEPFEDEADDRGDSAHTVTEDRDSALSELQASTEDMDTASDALDNLARIDEDDEGEQLPMTDPQQRPKKKKEDR